MQKEVFSGLKTDDGEQIYTQEYVQSLRDDTDKRAKELRFVAQLGGQEDMLAIDADIKICGGSRGGSKSFTSLMEVLKDIKNPHFKAVILRNEKPDVENLETDSRRLFSQFGKYNKSKNDMTWNFDNGGSLSFSYYAGDFEKDFKIRFQGKQYSYICIDEGTQCPYKKFKYLLTNNRNGSGIRNRFWITCNPDPESWVRKFIDWWVDEDGYIDPQKNGVIRYCFMEGDSPNSIYWGDTREEVYEQCKDKIDAAWDEKYEKFGLTKAEMFVKSVTFVRADVSDNIELVSTDPSYLANLAQQDEEQVMRDLKANWNFKASGDDMIKMEDLEAIYDNAEQIDDGIDRASADIAFTGGDNFVMWHWRGWHCVDLIVCRLDSRTLVSVVSAKLREWGVQECNFTYDMQGIGQYFKGFFPDAIPFNNQAAPIAGNRKEEDGIKKLYKDLKSQCAFLFYLAVKDRKISIDSDLLDRKYSGKDFEKVPLRQILMKERKMLRRDETSDDSAFRLIKKKEAKKYVGHSPDFFESLFYRMIFTLTKKKHKKIKGLWML
nr:MAG TPA: Terminase like protein [Caudoviricetes sp.]